MVYSIITFTFLVSTTIIFITWTVPDGMPSCVSIKASKLFLNSSSSSSSSNTVSSSVVSMVDSI